MLPFDKILTFFRILHRNFDRNVENSIKILCNIPFLKSQNNPPRLFHLDKSKTSLSSNLIKKTFKVYTEYLLKNLKVEFWVQNIYFYLNSIIFNLLILVVRPVDLSLEGFKNPFVGIMTVNLASKLNQLHNTLYD